MVNPFPTTLLDFQRMFPDERACGNYLERVRWPDGFVCPGCGVAGAAYRFENRPTVLRCRVCQREAHLTAGTVMHATRTPLQVWFWGAYLVTTQTPGMSALQFQRQLGLHRYETAFQVLHKLRAGMVRPDRDRIGTQWPVELDEALVGGKTRGEGRGVHHKTYVAGAVEVREKRAKRRPSRHLRRASAPAGAERPRQALLGGERLREHRAARPHHHRWLAGVRQPGGHRLRPRVRRAQRRPGKRPRRRCQ